MRKPGIQRLHLWDNSSTLDHGRTGCSSPYNSKSPRHRLHKCVGKYLKMLHCHVHSWRLLCTWKPRQPWKQFRRFGESTSATAPASSGRGKPVMRFLSNKKPFLHFTGHLPQVSNLQRVKLATYGLKVLTF